MHLPFRLDNRFWILDVRKKSITYHLSSKALRQRRFGFTLIELLVARHPKPWRRKAAFGFTLIELLVVISIIAILMAVATVSYLNAQQKGRDNKRKSDLKAVQQALELYYNQNGKYPAGTGSIQCNTGTNQPTNGDNATKNWNAVFSCDPDGTAGSQSAITYMNPLPRDPTNNLAYYYDSSSPWNSYKIYAKLENSNDKDLTTAPTSCAATPPSGGYGPPYFCFVNP